MTKEMFIEMLKTANTYFDVYNGEDGDTNQEVTFIELDNGATFEFDLNGNIVSIY